jgi:hypothetical protein
VSARGRIQGLLVNGDTPENHEAQQRAQQFGEEQD